MTKTDMQFPFREARETRAAFSVCSSNHHHRHRGTPSEAVIFGVYHYGNSEQHNRVIIKWGVTLAMPSTISGQENIKEKFMSHKCLIFPAPK